MADKPPAVFVPLNIALGHVWGSCQEVTYFSQVLKHCDVYNRQALVSMTLRCPILGDNGTAAQECPLASAMNHHDAHLVCGVATQPTKMVQLHVVVIHAEPG